MKHLQLDAIEIQDGLTIADMKRLFGLEAPPIDTPERRLAQWEAFANGTNMVRVDDVLYSWDTRPRIQKNGAAIGRIYAQPRGQSPHELGAYKIDAGGRVVWMPTPLQAVLPGAEISSEEDGHGC